jgi:hypothetical protein
MEMTDASLGVAVLRHALTNNAPLQELRAVSSEMNASTGGMTIIAPTDNSIKSSSSGVNIIELEAVPGFNAAQDEFNALRNAQ